MVGMADHCVEMSSSLRDVRMLAASSKCYSLHRPCATQIVSCLVVLSSLSVLCPPPSYARLHLSSMLRVCHTATPHT